MAAPYYQDDLVTLYHGDCLKILPELDIRADVLLTDPPYFKVKEDEWDNQWSKAHEFLSWLGQFLDTAKPLLEPHASVWVFASPAMTSSVERLVGERFRVLNSIRWVKEQGWHQKAEVAAMRSYLTPWEGIVFAEQQDDLYISADYEGHKRALRDVGEYLQSQRLKSGVTRKQLAEVLVRHGAYSNQDSATAMTSDHESGAKAITEAAYRVWVTLIPLRPFADLATEYGVLKQKHHDLRHEYENLRRPFNLTERSNSTDVWNFPTVAPYPGKHPCEKPSSMLRHMVETSSRPGHLILDPFAGSGATLEAAKHTGRRAVGIEKDARYCKQIAYRLSQDLLDFGASA